MFTSKRAKTLSEMAEDRTTAGKPMDMSINLNRYFEKEWEFEAW